MIPEILYVILVQLSLATLGVVVVTAGVVISRRPPAWYGYLSAKIGIGLVVGIILRLVLPNRLVDPGTYTYLYFLALALICFGVTVVCRDVLRRTARATVLPGEGGEGVNA